MIYSSHKVNSLSQHKNGLSLTVTQTNSTLETLQEYMKKFSRLPLLKELMPLDTLQNLSPLWNMQHNIAHGTITKTELMIVASHQKFPANFDI